MKKLRIPKCKKCGGKMEIQYINPIRILFLNKPDGLYAGCSVCGFIEKIKSLDEQ